MSASLPITVQPVIMAGGSGTRLWPLSRENYPKQFLVLAEKFSLFQQAILRLSSMKAAEISVAAPCIVGNEDHRFLLADQMREIGVAPSSILLEPVGRNTAPALTLAALQAISKGQDPVLVVTPADQAISDLPAFQACLRQALVLAERDSIVILGIRPDRPETGFGYIKTAVVQNDSTVQQFVEKPDPETAARYLADGSYFWNSGLFVLKASIWLDAIRKFSPDVLNAVQGAYEGREADPPFLRPDRAAFARTPSISVDYAVMERCPGSEFDIRMLPLAAGWSDLGAWDSVWQISEKDRQGNISIGDTILENTQDSFIQSTSRLVSVVGLDNLIVVETPDAVLVAHRNCSQDVKKIVSRLDAADRTEQKLHRQVHRPWGWYDGIDSGSRFQVKRIMVKPGATLSLQKHHHRAEHWIVVCGTAEVTCGDKKMILSENQSTYIPLGEVHRLANPGKVPLEIIEVQSGSYLGEDDIVRLEDSYGRVN